MQTRVVESRSVNTPIPGLSQGYPYWSAYVTGNAMTEAFAEVQIGDSMAISGTLDGKEYFLWGLKEPSYVMKMMATGGLLLANKSCGEQKC